MASYDSDSDGVQSLRDASIHPMSQTGSGNILFDLALLTRKGGGFGASTISAGAIEARRVETRL